MQRTEEHGRGKIDSLRKSERERKTEQRREESLLIQPEIENRQRRIELEQDDEAWLMHYFGEGCELADPFTYTFTSQQREMINVLGAAIRFGGDQSIAASRGEGKSIITKRMVLKGILQGLVPYAVIFASTGPMAEAILDDINSYVSENPLLLADYPEVCHPVISLERTPQRANTQRMSGNRFDNGEPFEYAELSYRWCGSELIFPATPGAPASGAIIATRGLDAAVRGLTRYGRRPSIAVIDDPDTETTASSEEQAAKLEKRIDAAIGGLGSQRRSIGRVMLTTIQSRISVSYKYTEPTLKPTFKGRRYRFLVKPPQRTDLWDKYVAMRQEDFQLRDDAGKNLDPWARRSHRFYLDNRADMDAGAVVSNLNRYENDVLPDRTIKEASALQHYYNLVAKLGPEVVATEYDNDPPSEAEASETALTTLAIQSKVNGHDRGIVPNGCILVTIGVDVRKTELHWVARAWDNAGNGHTIHYGIHDVVGTIRGSDDGVDLAIHKAILKLVEKIRRDPFCKEDGEIADASLILIDAGYRTDAVYAACHHLGAGVMPVMGFGKSSGCTQANFADAQRATIDKRPGDGWFLSRKGKTWLVCADADRWKAWEHDRWLTDADTPGTLKMWGRASEDKHRLSDDQIAHKAYARHILSEVEIEESHRGSLRRRWKARGTNNHWLDASYYASVAMSIRGLRLQEAAPSNAQKRTDPAARPSLKDLAQGRKP